jgi:formamidopyrimidine-DNA glycosylase
MPELPEVETTRRGVKPHILGQPITEVIVRQSQLRWPVPADLDRQLRGQVFTGARRRAKYLLLDTESGSLMVHLGMSGSLRLMPADAPALFHDHIDIVLGSGQCLRYNDPRRFGSFHWLTSDDHPLLNHLGPEPLSTDFSAEYLHTLAKRRKVPVKQFLMDGKVVVGVGNIYANEALFMSGIRPDRGANRIALARYERLVNDVKTVLSGAIEQGGTTLRDFVGGDGKPGYFAQQLRVYGRGGQPCRQCAVPLTEIRQGGRATVFCRHCQR